MYTVKLPSTVTDGQRAAVVEAVRIVLMHDCNFSGMSVDVETDIDAASPWIDGPESYDAASLLTLVNKTLDSYVEEPPIDQDEDMEYHFDTKHDHPAEHA